MQLFPEPDRAAHQCQLCCGGYDGYDADHELAAPASPSKKPPVALCSLVDTTGHRSLGRGTQAAAWRCNVVRVCALSFICSTSCGGGGSNGGSGNGSPGGGVQGGTLPGTYTINLVGSPASLSQPRGSSVTLICNDLRNNVRWVSG
jgi:hypothetical protein